MKESFVVISHGALFSVFMVGGLLIDAMYCHKHGDMKGFTLDLAIAFAMLLLIRADVRQIFRTGKYTRGWFTWEWVGEVNERAKSNPITGEIAGDVA